MRPSFEKAIAGALVLSAAAVAISAVRQSFFPTTASGELAPDRIASWEDALAIGRPIGGDTDAPVKVVVLSDLECPACASFHRTLLRLISSRTSDVQGIFVSHPLPYHKFALAAAQGAECAAAAGRFREWIDAVFAARDSLGLKPWSAYATAAGVVDTSRFLGCMSNNGSARIDAGLSFGSRIALAGTPTVIVNGLRFRRTPTFEMMDTAVSAAIRKAPRR